MAQLNEVIFPTGDYIIDTHTYYGTCTTAGATTAKAVTCADFTTPMTDCPAGTSVRVKFTHGNTAEAPTLNINSQGAKPIVKYGTTEPGASTGCSWRADSIVTFTYDGTNWIMNDVNDFAKTVFITDTSPSSGEWYNLVFTGDIVADTPYYLRGSKGVEVYMREGTEDVNGYAVLVAGNTLASGTAGNKTGIIRLCARDTNHYVQIRADYDTAANVDHTLPGTAGTILNTGTTSYSQTYANTGTKIGTITINNTATDIYAPTPTSDTKNTAGSTDTSSKIYLIGATSQADSPQTYSDNEVYVTSGVLTTKSVQVGGTSGGTMQYNSSTESIDFVFA